MRLCGCFGGRSDLPQHYSITPSVESNVTGDIPDDRKGTVLVELQKKEGCGLGLTVSGGVDKGQRPQVSNLRPGSIAHRCDALLVGDYIISVNGIRTGSLRHEEIINLLKNAGTNVTLEIEYEIPDSSPLGPNVHSKVEDVLLDKELSGFGLTLRGGMIVDRMKAHPLMVVSVRHGGPADREGSIKVGDRVVAINGYKVTHLSLSETLSLFTQCDMTASFTMSYDVAVMEAVENASGPLLIEIERPQGSGLGITLSQSVHDGRSCVGVESVQPMSIADRSGALHPGDHILAIDGANVESMTVAEASQLLKSGTEHCVQLEIIPVTHLENCANRDILNKNSLVASFSSHTLPIMPQSPSTYTNLSHQHFKKSSTIGGYGSSSDRGANTHLHSFADNTSVGTSQFGTLNMRKRNLWAHGPERRATSCMSIASSSASVLSANNQVCHTETVEVILFANDRKGIGITLKGGVFSTAPLSHPPTITYVEPRSAAEKCGVLQEGDRVLAINGVETTDRTLEEVNHFIRESRPRCVLLVEFDVTESVTPSSGTYVVKLAKRAGDTGITVNATPSSNKSTKDALYISDVRKGSVSHRTGSIQPGDKLLAINDVRLDTCLSEDAMHLLELPDDIVKLKLRRDDPDEGNEGYIIYTVELQRFGGPLGITISGTEDPLDPIVISELTSHGLADRTGAIHVGDRLLAVSGNTTKNKPLSEAIRMLQSAGDVVTLKIARPDPSADGAVHINPFAFGHTTGKPSTPIPSIDSAMESWNSSAHDIVGNSNGHQEHNGVMVLAVPQMPDSKRKSTHSSSDYIQEDSSRPQSSLDWDANSEISMSSSAKDHCDEDEDDSDENSSTQMDDWVKTLEEFDMGSGSEMLKQIGMSLRQRSVHSLDHQSPPEVPERPARPEKFPTLDNNDTGVKLRSKSMGRANGCSSKSSDGLNRNSAVNAKSQSLVSKAIKNFEQNQSTIEVTKPSKDLKRFDPSAKSCDAIHTKTTTTTTTSFSKKSPSRVSKSRNSYRKSQNADEQIHTIFTPAPIQFQRVVLEKSKQGEDYGFSLSDGLYERGVYISAVRSGSLADKAGLRGFDRVLQINRVKTKEFDCCLAVPLISDADKRLSLVVCRNPLLRLSQTMKDEKRVEKGATPTEKEMRGLNSHS